jgi:hypothetical protein
VTAAPRAQVASDALRSAPVKSRRPLVSALRWGVVVAVVALAGALPLPALAGEGEVGVVAAETAYSSLKYDPAIKEADAAIKAGKLSHDQFKRAYRVLALSLAVIGKEDRARDAFVLLLTSDPEFKVDHRLGPKVEQPFLEAKGFWRGQPATPGIEVVAEPRRSDGGTLRVTLKDPTKVVKRTEIAYRWGGEGKFTTTAAQGGEQLLTISRPPDSAVRLDYYAQAFDQADNTLFELGNPTAPETTSIAAYRPVTAPIAPVRQQQQQESQSLFASPPFWIAAGLTVAGVVAGAIYFSTRSADRNATHTSANFGPTLFCGDAACR